MSAERIRFPGYAEMQNPLFLHPSDGPNTIAIANKLQGSSNYRSWRRSMEINLSTKRKLGFVKGTIERAVDDPIKAEQWDTCNSLVIAWIMNSVSDSIAKSILYVETASEIWIQLQTRFSLSNGSRKYKLNKEVYNLKQSGGLISDYFTKMNSLWIELDAMDVLPRLTNANQEVRDYLKRVDSVKQEQRLFQFLSGLDECYNAQRSQLLLLTELPTVDVACSMLQEEESQRDSRDNAEIGGEMSALYGKSDEKCKICGNKWHPKEKCWTVIGYPSWHYKSKKFPQKPGTNENEAKSDKGNGRGKSDKGNGHAKSHKTAAQVTISDEKQGSVTFTQKQFEAFMKRMSQGQREEKMDGTDDELDMDFAGTVFCSNVSSITEEWILDTGATDHMTPMSKDILDPIFQSSNTKINLPNGHTSPISHHGLCRQEAFGDW